MGFGADALQILGMKEIVGVRAEEVFRLVAEQTTAGRADVEVASVGLVQADEVAGLLREQAELLLALPECILRQLALRNVPRDAFDGDDSRPRRRSACCAARSRSDSVLAIPAQHEGLIRSTHRVLQQMSVFWVDQLETEIRVGVVLLRRVAGHGCGRRAYVLEAWRRMEAGTGRRGPLRCPHERPETLFVLARRILASQPASHKVLSRPRTARPANVPPATMRRNRGARLEAQMRSSEGHLTR